MLVVVELSSFDSCKTAAPVLPRERYPKLTNLSNPPHRPALGYLMAFSAWVANTRRTFDQFNQKPAAVFSRQPVVKGPSDRSSTARHLSVTRPTGISNSLHGTVQRTYKVIFGFPAFLNFQLAPREECSYRIQQNQATLSKASTFTFVNKPANLHCIKLSDRFSA